MASTPLTHEERQELAKRALYKQEQGEKDLAQSAQLRAKEDGLPPGAFDPPRPLPKVIDESGPVTFAGSAPGGQETGDEMLARNGIPSRTVPGALGGGPFQPPGPIFDKPVDYSPEARQREIDAYHGRNLDGTVPPPGSPPIGPQAPPPGLPGGMVVAPGGGVQGGPGVAGATLTDREKAAQMLGEPDQFQKAELQFAAENVRQAKDQTVQHGMANANAISGIVGEGNSKLETSSFNEEMRTLIAKEDADKMRKEIDAKSTEARNMKIDPDRLWNQKSAPAKVASIIALAMGTFAMIRQGRTTNHVQQMIDKQVDDDINAQRSAIAQANGKVEDMRGIYADLRRQGMEDSVAAAGARKVLHDSIVARIGAQVAASKSQEIQDGWKVASAELFQTDTKNGVAANSAIDSMALRMSLGGGKAGPKEGKGDGAEIKEYLHQTMAAGVPVSQETIDQTLATFPQTGDIEGIGPLKNAISESGSVGKFALNAFGSDEAARNRANVEKLTMMFQQSITGKGASDKERENIRNAFLAAKDAQGIRSAVDYAQSIASAVDQHFRRGLSDTARNTLEERTARETAAARQKGTARAGLVTGGPPK